MSDVLDAIIEERLEIICFNLQTEDQNVYLEVQKIKTLSSNINDDKSISKELQRYIEEYMHYTHSLNMKMQKAAYKEGVKDSIKLLKALGVLM
jgi:hypothetical protein